MRHMFSDSNNLTSLDLSNFDTHNVTNMSAMFEGCWHLTSLDLSKFDTRNVTDMNRMFYLCFWLTSLDLSHFDTSNVTDMRNLFYGCKSLTSLDVSNFDYSKVTHISVMFSYLEKLTSLNLGDFDITKVSSAWDLVDGTSSDISITLTDVTGLLAQYRTVSAEDRVLTQFSSKAKEVLFDCTLTTEQWATLTRVLGDKAKALGPVGGKMKVSMRNGVSDTFCCKYNLDFAAATADGCPLRAYIGSYYVPEASVGEGDLYYSRIQYVPAGTGVILKGGEANVEYQIPVTDVAPIVANLMVGCTKDTPVTALMDGNKTFIYSGSSGALVQVPEAGGTVKAGRAYLAIPASLLPWNLSSGAQIRQIFDDGEATGIETLEDASEKEADGAYYSLNGQRVVAPTKGIYIKNDKKVYVK